jgi:glucose/arabinose dehydrogenase
VPSKILRSRFGSADSRQPGPIELVSLRIVKSAWPGPLRCLLHSIGLSAIWLLMACWSDSGPAGVIGDFLSLEITVTVAGPDGPGSIPISITQQGASAPAFTGELPVGEETVVQLPLSTVPYAVSVDPPVNCAAGSPWFVSAAEAESKSVDINLNCTPFVGTLLVSVGAAGIHPPEAVPLTVRLSGDGEPVFDGTVPSNKTTSIDVPPTDLAYLVSIDVPKNCDGGATQEARVEFKEATPLAFEMECERIVGNLTITMSSTGPSQPASYAVTVVLDGAQEPAFQGNLGNNATTSLPIPSFDRPYAVRVQAPSNCSGDISREVVVPTSGEALLDIEFACQPFCVDGIVNGDLCLTLFADDLFFPTYLVSPPNDERVFITQIVGNIILVEPNRRSIYLDLSSEVFFRDENGLLGMVFHPDFANNGRFFLYYTDLNDDSVLEEFTVDPAARSGEGAARRVVLRIPQPEEHHLGGQLQFGPDGMLWIGLGDGNIPTSAQDLGDLKGSIIRIDVDSETPYGIPQDNPFVGVEGARGEIVHSGLRNPWRFSIDAELGLLLVGDVGLNDWEEVNIAPTTMGGRNYGWPFFEGLICLSAQCPTEGLTEPNLVYSHNVGCSVIGGYIYRGVSVESLRGRYVFADHCSGLATATVAADGSVSDVSLGLFPGLGLVSSMGVDARGELYLLFVDTGKAYRVEPAS